MKALPAPGSGHLGAQGFRAGTWRAGSSSSTPKVPSPLWDPPLQASYPLLPVARSSAPAGELVLSMAAPGQGHPWTGPPRPWGTPVPGSWGRELSVLPGKAPGITRCLGSESTTEQVAFL